jgi:hypothetical protein
MKACYLSLVCFPKLCQFQHRSTRPSPLSFGRYTSLYFITILIRQWLQKNMITKCTKCSTVQRLWTKLRHFWRYLLPGTRFVRIALRKKWDKRGQCVSFIKICHKTSLLFVCCFFFLFCAKKRVILIEHSYTYEQYLLLM